MKKYQIIYADPPWQQKKGGLRKCRPNQKRTLDYQTLSNNEIENIFLSFMGFLPTKDNADILFLVKNQLKFMK